MVKAYTNLEQSKKLAEILPIESADMYWFNRHIDLTETRYEVFVIDTANKYIDFFKSYAVAVDDNEIIPCWSLTALLDILPEGTRLLKSATDDTYHCDCPKGNIEKWFDNPVDACYEMILKLHEQKLL